MTHMDVAALAKAQAVNRVAMGAGLMLAPAIVGRVWSASEARDERAKVLARALGARDLALGAGGLLALREGDTAWAQRAFAAQAAADAVDLVAILAAGPALPPMKRITGCLMAGGSAAVAAAYAARLRRA
jgi:hypothetical protein